MTTTPKAISAGDLAIVTGGARRIGRAISLALATEAGLDVAVHYGRSKSAADNVVAEISAAGCRGVAVAADLRKPAAAAETVFNAANQLGTARVLVNCAAVFDDRDLADVDAEHWNEQLTVNALAPLLLSQQFVNRLPDGVSGHIINLVDWRATRAPASHAVYSASKAALVSLTQSLAQQLAPRVLVNAIAPGAILPPPGEDDWHERRASNAIPLKRRGNPQDICEAVLYLLKSTFVTGEVLHVCGGEQL